MLEDRLVYSESRENGLVVEAYYDPETGEIAVAKGKRWCRTDAPKGKDLPYEQIFETISHL